MILPFDGGTGSSEECSGRPVLRKRGHWRTVPDAQAVTEKIALSGASCELATCVLV